MSENLTFKHQNCCIDKLQFCHLREMEVGESKVFIFPENYSVAKARNLANTYRSYYQGTQFSINSQKDGSVKITRKA